MRKHGRRGREMFVPLVHPPWHAQTDFVEARAVIGGAVRKVHLFALDLPYSGACDVRAYSHAAGPAIAWVSRGASQNR